MADIKEQNDECKCGDRYYPKNIIHLCGRCGSKLCAACHKVNNAQNPVILTTWTTFCYEPSCQNEYIQSQFK